MNRILVIGATGNIGSQVVSDLAATGAQVRALSRNPDEAHLPSQIEVVRGDLTQPETLDHCLADVDAVFLVWTAPRAAVAPALGRILKNKSRIVFLSSPYKTAHPFFQQPNPVRELHAEIERVIEHSGVEWTFLRPGMLAMNAKYWWGPQIRAGDVVRWPYLSVPTAPIDERDIAAVAVRTLLEDGHAGSEYVITGPDSLSQFEQVSIIGRAIDRRLRIEEISPDEARRELLTLMPAFIIEMLLDAWKAGIGRPAHVTSTVAEVTGTPARTFQEWATARAADF